MLELRTALGLVNLEEKRLVLKRTKWAKLY
jgi:hypothetical protein